MKKNILTVGLFATSMLLTCNVAQASLINGGFEDPAYSSRGWYTPETIPGWETTDRAFELWSHDFQGVTAYEGNQHAELNAYIAGTLSQDVVGLSAGDELGFEFAHRGRQGTDTMQLSITDLGIDNTYGTSDDTNLFSKNYSTGNTDWAFYTNTGEESILALGNTTRFAYSAVGGSSIGNFLDAADFGVGVNSPGPSSSVPEPASFALMSIGLFGLTGLRRRRKKNK